MHEGDLLGHIIKPVLWTPETICPRLMHIYCSHNRSTTHLHLSSRSVLLMSAERERRSLSLSLSHARVLTKGRRVGASGSGRRASERTERVEGRAEKQQLGAR